jgi:hypothetical protein
LIAVDLHAADSRKMVSDPEFFKKLNLVVEDERVLAVFRAIAQQLGVSGWEIAKQVKDDDRVS